MKLQKTVVGCRLPVAGCRLPVVGMITFRSYSVFCLLTYVFCLLTTDNRQPATDNRFFLTFCGFCGEFAQ
jgi:hypothetical protein